MAAKSSFNLYVDDDAGTSMQIASDSSGWMLVIMSDGKNTVQMKMSQVNAALIAPAFLYENNIKNKIPQS